MGLDATAYGHLTKLENPELDSDGCPTDESISFYENPDFPGRIAGIEGSPTFYGYTGWADCFSGGYGRYNAWRELLAKLAGYPAVKVKRHEFSPYEMRHDQSAFDAGSGPFYELINFSDCEGTIGPVVSAKLAKDFAEYQCKADAVDDDSFKSTYADWRKGFELAACGGAVKFS